MGFVEHRPVGQILVEWLDIGQEQTIVVVL